MKAVILAGGGGTRLWPLSTTARPKQFQRLISEKTLIEEAVERLDFLAVEDIYIATNIDHLDLIQELCPKIPKENIIIEPALRDTASCIGYAAAIIAKKFPEEVMSVIYADHHIKNKKEFQEKLKVAERVAMEKNTLNIIEVSAKTPDTNYGYVQIGELDEEIENSKVYKFKKFTEKPDLETAKKFIESGDYLWNTGIYVWKAKTLLDHYKKIQPETYEKFIKMAQFPNLTAELYPTLEKISIDYAIMEKVDPSEVRIIKAELDLSDVGNWEAVWNENAQSPNENVSRGAVKTLDCEGCLIYADNNKPIKAIGLKNIVIVETPDGLIVSKKSKSKRIKELG